MYPISKKVCKMFIMQVYLVICRDYAPLISRKYLTKITKDHYFGPFSIKKQQNQEKPGEIYADYEF